MNLNRLLLRQIQKYHGGLSNIPAEYHKFLEAVSESYDHYEKDHTLLERTIDLSSNEMMQLNDELREETKKLAAADQELRMLFENIDETFFSVDMKSFRVLQMSNTCEKQYGYKKEDFFANAYLWQSLIHPEDMHISQQQIKELLEGKKVLNQYRIIRRDGSIRWVENKVIPTMDEAGALERIDGITRDITDRKNAEQLLVESEKRYKLVFENPLFGVALGTLEGYLQNANGAFCELLGYTREEITNVHFSTFTHPADMDKELHFISEMTAGRIDSYQLEKRFTTKSGQTIWVELSVSSVKNEAQEIQLIIAVIQDITSRKLAEEARLKSEANLKNIFENTDTAYLLLDVEGRILSSNKIARQMILEEFGRAFAEGERYTDLMPEEKRHSVNEKIGSLLLNGREVKYETYYVQGNSPRWLYVSMHPIFNEAGSIIGLSVASNDITDRKRKAEQIKRSNERYKLVTKATKDVIWDWNFSNGKIYRSINVWNMFGYNSRQGEGVWMDSIYPEDRKKIQASIMEAINDPNATLWEGQYRRYRASGELAYVQDRGYIVRDKDKRPLRMVGAMSDITTEKTLSIERDKITSDLLQRNRDLEQFSFIVSHNLRQPVANIMGLVNLIMNGSQLSEADSKKCLEGLFLSSSKLDNVIKDLSYILQVRKEVNERKEPVSFSQLVDDIKISIQGLIQKEEVTIETDFKEADSIHTLKSYMYSIFFNLISNSIKYRNGEAPVIRISSKKINDRIVLTFKDNSMGIDLAKQSGKIFGLYHKFHSHKEGKGMGLYMTKTQVEILGGSITVQSAVNHGAEFSIELPE